MKNTVKIEGKLNLEYAISLDLLLYLRAKNDPKLRKRPGWPENLVSYKKKRVSINGKIGHFSLLLLGLVNLV